MPSIVSSPLLLTLLIQDTPLSLAQETVVKNGEVDLENCVNQESQFNIRLEFMGTGPIDERFTEAFEWAAQRWSKVIVGDLPDAQPIGVTDWFAGNFEGRSFAEPVDDVVIGYDIPETIDGPGGTLGSAGAVFIRRDRSGNPQQTISGIMTFDGADMAEMAEDDIKLVIQHEMGHVLGLVGTTTSRCTQACDRETPSEQATYGCPLAFNEYALISTGQSLELENQGGVGTACGHWEEDVFRTQSSSEVMTGFFEANLFQPLSSVTIAGLEDLGYEVDYCGADIWPATEETIKRYDVYKASRGMEMDTIVETKDPVWNFDPATGEKSPWGNRESGENNSSGSSLKSFVGSLAAFGACLLLI